MYAQVQKKEIASKYGEKKLGSVDDDNVCQSTLEIRSSNGVSIPVFSRKYQTYYEDLQ